MAEIICEACGWMAVTSEYPPLVWAEHAEGCPAVGGAVRYDPPRPPLPPLPPRPACKHRLIKRHVATLANGKKRYAVLCDLCGRHLPPPNEQRRV
jgi:hypothetical protein